MSGDRPPSAEQPLEQTLDDLIEMAEAAHPGAEFGLHVSELTSLLMPTDGSRPHLWRKVEGRAGYHHSASYCQHEIVPDAAVADHVVCCVALRDVEPGSAPISPLYANIDTGEISTAYPD